jgi:hypothetical protein
MAKNEFGLGNYKKMQEELPRETSEGVKAGAVGLATVTGLILGDIWYNTSLLAPGEDIDNDGVLNSQDEDFSSGNSNPYTINTAKAIRRDLIPKSTSELATLIESYLNGGVGLSSLIASGIPSGVFDIDPDAKDLQEKSKKVKEVIMGWSPVAGTSATRAALDILAYNIMTSSVWGDLLSISPGEQTWYETSYINSLYNQASQKVSNLLSSEEDQELKKQLIAQRQQSILNGKTEKELDAQTEEDQIRDVKFHFQALLAANIQLLAQNSMGYRSYSIPKYNKTYMMNALPSEIINKLTYVKGSETFADISVAEASSLVPLIRLFKIRYDSKGEHIEDLPMVFSSYVRPGDVHPGRGHAGVGIKSFDWQYNGTNPAATKNDITAKLVLYFQNFNDLLKVQSTGFKYVDLLVRTSPSADDDTATDLSIDEAGIPDASSPTADLANPEHFEIKAAVGWAPNTQYAAQTGNTSLTDGILGQTTNLFLTLVEHEFSIQQDGTFTLSINYRGRIDGIIMDKKADIILTPEDRKRLCHLQNELEAANKDCSADSIDKIKHDIKLAKQKARNQSGMDIMLGLLQENKVYCVELTKEKFDERDGQIIKIQPEDLTGIKKLKLLSSKDLNSQDDAILEDYIADMRFELESADNSKNIGGCEDTWSEWIASGVGTGVGMGYSFTQATVDIFGSDAAAEIVDNGYDAVFGGEVDATDESTVNDCFLQASAEAQGTTAAGDEVTDADAYETPEGDLSATFGLREADDGRLIIPYFFFGDLVDLAATRAIGIQRSSPKSTDKCDDNYHPNRVQNLGIILGTMHLDKFGAYNEATTVNLGDIPIALPYFRDWWARNITKPEVTTYSLLAFIRKCLKDFVVDAVGGDILDGRRPQRVLVKDGSVSLPALRDDYGNNISPVEYKIQSSPINFGSGNSFDPSKLVASRLPGSSITNQNPMTPINGPWNTVIDMYHYKIFYIVNESPTYLNGIRSEDNKRGIQHIVMGARSGLLKDVQFQRTTLEGLREQRVVEESEVNPLKHLADVYNITAKMIGSVIFYPGQLVYLNPIGFGSKLGLPTDPTSPSRAMGLGGYHLITQVSNYIESGKFETTVTALYETSGGKNAKRANNGREIESEKCDTSFIETVSDAIFDNLDQDWSEGG